MLNSTEQNILRTLVELDQAVKSMAVAQPKPNLLPMFKRLDELARQLPANGDPELRHFLQQKSYEKARASLESRVTERGTCGH